MFVEYNGKTYAFRFMHITKDEAEFSPEGLMIIPRQTVCLVQVKEGEDWKDLTVQTQEGDVISEHVVVGIARVHPNDKNFVKEIGRQISLGNALKKFVPKEDRIMFWETYRNWKTSKPRMLLSTNMSAIETLLKESKS